MRLIIQQDAMKLCNRYFFGFLGLASILLSFQTTDAGIIRGRVTGTDGEPLPFATLHIKNTSTGTITNGEGYFSIDLPPGRYQLIFQYVGYKTISHAVTLGKSPVQLDVTMEEEILHLKELVITSTGEDPAYAIIRKAIEKRKFYLNEVEAYHCNVYIKGLQRLDKAPDNVLGVSIPVDTGIVYLSESVSEFSFKQPDKIREVMISSKVSGDNQAFSFNKASDMMFTFYKNLLQVEGLNPRGFVSPIASNALMFYRYALEGVIQENGQRINKIKVTPIRPNDPVFTGYIYILDNSWRIHSLDLLLTKANQIEFIDSVTIKQVYAPAGDGRRHDIPWMMISQSFDFTFKAFGFEGDGYFIGVYSDYELEPKLERRYFSNEVMSIADEANERDSVYWANIRPVPLTRIEKIDYLEKDSVRVIRESRHYMDSVDRERNKIGPGNLLLSGYTRYNSYEDKSWHVPPLTQILQFNTVEGFAPNLSLTYRKMYEDRKAIRIAPALRYGFASEQLNGKLEAFFYYNPKKFAYGGIGFGRFVTQFNQDRPLSPFFNTLYTLLEGHNYLKIYDRSFIDLYHEAEIVNGVKLSTKVSYAERKPLFNSNEFSFRDGDDIHFTPNAPQNAEWRNTEFFRHQALVIDIGVSLHIAQKFVSRPDRKIIVESKYPEISFQYKKGLPKVMGSDIDFDMLEASVGDEIDFGLLGAGNYLFFGGSFVNADSLAFMDFKHFNGNRTIFGNFDMGNFQLLDFYLFSTRKDWYGAQYEHHFNGFIFNKFPLVRKLNLQAVARVNYLHTDALKNYFELGFGIEHILKIGRVDFFTGFREGNRTRTGFRLGIGF